ncbi:MAG: M28 family peptidase [Candidatus Omnitrophica bacterium]|nr:M28 family peptidase [Candidatus Omnitrophota bacterium]
MLRLIIFALVVFIIFKITTFGWRSSGKSFLSFAEENVQLVEKLKQHVYKLSQEIGDRSVFKYDKLQEAAKYITQEFKSFGYDVEFQEYSFSNLPSKNIIATKIGGGKLEEIIILGAHYDTCFNPGANDNASAVAGLLELARLISKQQINRSIKFIAFVNEEPPFFKTDNMGSRIYVKEAKTNKQDIKAVLILEMIGYYTNKPHSQRYPLFFGLFYPSKANFIAIVGNFQSGNLVKKVVSEFKNHSQFPIESVTTFGFVPGVDFSDHWSFWKEDFPAIMITDTAFYRYTYYHSSSDTYEKLNYEAMAEVIKGLEAVLMSLAK